jgi:group II intron reverse transcriptase/maturase
MECSRRRKVHSLIDKVYDPANLAEAWKRVRENKGSAGIDGLTVAGFEQRQDELLETLHKQLREKTYRPSPVKRVAIPKLGGGTRNLGIPSVRDRVVQQALVQKMNPIFEPVFADCSFGYRPGRSPHMAMRKVWREIQEGNFWILDADLRSYFDSIDQNRLVDLICDQISRWTCSATDPRFSRSRSDRRRRMGTNQDGGPARRGSQPALVEHFPDAL